MVKLDIKFQGTNIAVKNLNRMGLTDMEKRKLLYQMGQEQADRIKARVAMGIDVDGNRIKPSQRAIKDRGQTLMGKTGLMLGALRVVQVTAQKAVVAFGIPAENLKAFWHQYGTSRMPRRKFFGLSKDDKKNIVKLAADFMRRKATK